MSLNEQNLHKITFSYIKITYNNFSMLCVCAHVCVSSVNLMFKVLTGTNRRQITFVQKQKTKRRHCAKLQLVSNTKMSLHLICIFSGINHSITVYVNVLRKCTMYV